MATEEGRYENRNSDASEEGLGKIQRALLLIIAFTLALLIFNFKGGGGSKAPLDQLARRSIEPEIALNNGKPTVLEFYADWCEICREMAPDMLAIESEMSDKLDIVLLNVENPRWFDLLEKYEVNGIPQLNFFSAEGEPIGKTIGLINKVEINKLMSSLIKNDYETVYNKVNDKSQSIIRSNKEVFSISPRTH